MNVVTKVAAALLLTSLTAAPALAAAPAKPMAKPAATAPAKPMAKPMAKPVAKPVAKAPAMRVLTLKQVDANRDHKISYVELKTFYPKLTKGGYAAADLNHDGSLDVKELMAFFKHPVMNAPAKPKPMMSKPKAKPMGKPMAKPMAKPMTPAKPAATGK